MEADIKHQKILMFQSLKQNEEDPLLTTCSNDNYLTIW
jgi:hypothetical protein